MLKVSDPSTHAAVHVEQSVAPHLKNELVQKRHGQYRQAVD